MPWYDVYDNVEVQLLTRRLAAGSTAIVTIGLMLICAVVAFAIDGQLPASAAAGTVLMTCVVLGYWIYARIQRLRRIVWCIKFSRKHVVGYDYARRRILIPWKEVQRIELGDDSLTIVGKHPLALTVTHHFADYPQVSHRVVHYADRFEIPLFVNGTPWQQLDIYDVFPFLSDDAPPPRHGSTAL